MSIMESQEPKGPSARGGDTLPAQGKASHVRLVWLRRAGVSATSATLPSEETMPDDIPLAKLTVQCTLSIVTGDEDPACGAVGDGVA